MTRQAIINIAKYVLTKVILLNAQLIYFDFNGPRAGPVRLALHIGGIPYKDTRFAGKDWPQWKPKMVHGVVPVLKVDGEQIGESAAMLRFAAKLAGLYPSCEVLALKADSIVDVIEGCVSDLGPSMREKDDAKKKEMREATLTNKLKPLFEFLEKIYMEEKSTFLVGKALSTADLKLITLWEMMGTGNLDYIPPSEFDQYVKVKEAIAAVKSMPKIKDFYEKWDKRNAA
eukprot:g77595.t1